MKILHLVSSSGFYGAENVIAVLARDQQQSGHWVRIGIFENSHSPCNSVVAAFEARGIAVVRIVCHGRISRTTVKVIREILTREKIEILHSHGYKADFYAYLAGRHLGLSLISTVHSWTKDTLAVRLYEFIDAAVLSHFNTIVAVCETTGQALRQAGLPSTKISVVENGIDLARFAPSSSSPILACELNKGSKLLIGTAARLVRQKGVDYLLRAAQKLVKEFPNLLFVIVGHGPEGNRLQRLARDLQIENNICFAGTRSDMADVYASLDVFVLPSLGEGMPMVVLEALASARAVVATDVGAMRKLIVPGQTGLLVPPADDESLANAVADLVRDRTLRERLGTNGRARIHEKFSSRVMSEAYLRIYEHLLRRKDAGLRPVPSYRTTIS